MVKYCLCLNEEGFLKNQSWVGVRTKYDKKLYYIHDPEQFEHNSDHPWREEKSRSFTIYRKRMLEERLPSSRRNHAQCHAKA